MGGGESFIGQASCPGGSTMAFPSVASGLSCLCATLPHFAVVQVIFFLSFFFSCRDISFLYDASASGRTGLDSAGKSLITPGSEKSKGSMGSKQRETVMKSKDDNNQEAMVHSLMNNALKRKNWFAQGSDMH